MSEPTLIDLIRDIEVAMLTTVDDEGGLRSRPLKTLTPDSERELCFFTSATAPKVGEVEREHRVNLAYAHPGHQRYVSVSGTARLSRDRERIRALFRTAHRAWFPKGADDPDLALLCVEIERAELWDSPPAKVVQLVGLAKAVATGEPSRGVGAHRRIERPGSAS